MNSMFAKHREPLTSSERMKQKRNLNIYKTLESSNNIKLDKSNNIKNVVNYESYMNVVNGFYESRKLDISNNRDCFNVQLIDDTDDFKINTFEDVHNSFIDFKNTAENKMGISNYKVWNATTNSFEAPVAPNIGSSTDEGFVVQAVDVSGSALTNFLTAGGIEKAADIVYPYKKKGICSKLIIPNLTFYDPSGNIGKPTARDVKRFFPMSRISYNSSTC